MVDYCQYCLPTKRKSHLDLHADYYMEKIRRSLMWPVDALVSLFDGQADWLWGGILEFLAFFRAVEFVADPPRHEVFNRSLIILDEAKARGIEVEAIKIFGHFKNEYRYKINNLPWRYFEANPLADEQRGAADHKGEFKRLMRSFGVPVPEGRVFASVRAGLKFAAALGFPLVVKPATGSLGYHSTYLIQNEQDLKQAIRIAQDFRPDFIVEKHISGDNFRATVIGRKHVFVCGKDRANVVGDGMLTIEQLVDLKNSDPRRGEYGRKDTTLHRIPKSDPGLLGYLGNQGLSLHSIPAQGQKIHLFADFVPGSGIDFINLTDIVHRDNLQLFLKAAKALNTDLVGFDLIAEDMSRPYSAQTFAMLEANTLPYLDIHQFPSHGAPADIAKVVWDTVMENLV